MAKITFFLGLTALFFIFSFASAQAAEMQSRLVAIHEADAAGLPGRVYEIIYDADINEDGLLLFRGKTRAPSGERLEAVWKETSPGKVVLVGNNGPQTPALGFEFEKPLEAYWNTSDTVHAEWPSDDTNGFPVNAIWRFEYAPGSESELRLAQEGDAVPLTGASIGSITKSVNQTNNLHSNARKDIAFVGTLVDDNSQASTGALFFKTENGSIELVAREGEAAPGGGQFSNVFDIVFTKLQLAPDGSLWFVARVLEDDPNPDQRIFLYRNGTLKYIYSMGAIPAVLNGTEGLRPLTLCSVNSSGTAAVRGTSEEGQQIIATSDGSGISLYWVEPADRFANKIDGPRPEGGLCQFTDAGEVIIGSKMISGGYTIFNESVLGFSAGGAVRTIVEGTKPVTAIPGAVYRNIAGRTFDVNNKNQIAMLVTIDGAGIDNSNNEVLLLGTADEDFVVVARRGQLREVPPGIDAPILNLTLFNTGALTGIANFLSDNGDVAYGAYIDDKGALFVSSPADVILVDSFEDPPHVVVNSTDDGDDLSAGDEKCDTGNTIANGDAECTLRAAIQEVNSSSKVKLILFAIPGAAPHIIKLLDPLPYITKVAASIRGPQMVGDVPQVVVDGGGLDGIVVDAYAVRISGLGIQGFNSAGITLETLDILRLSSVHISGNCGFGVYAEGQVFLDDSGGGPSLIENNGQGSGCQGGGIFSASESIASKAVQVINSTIKNNNGPGILSEGPVWLTTVNIENNAAQGVSVQADAASIYIRLGNTSVAGNHGNGLESLGGGVDVDPISSINIRLNRGWGLLVRQGGRINFGSSVKIPADTSFIQFNGSAGGDCEAWSIDLEGLSKFTEACVGGGIVAISEPAIAHRLANLVIEDNGGPGVATMFGTKLRDVTIQRNKGPGIFVFDGDVSGPLNVPVVTADLGTNEISGNLGHGIMAEYGRVVANQGIDLSVRDNAGWGIVMQDGVAMLGIANDKIGVSRVISGNGFEAECFEWTYHDASDSVVPDPGHLGACPGGGVYSADFRDQTSFFDATTISGNNGPGILTEARVKLSRSIISENESSGITVVDAANAASADDLMVYSSLGGNELFSNKGHGIHVETGSVELEESLAMELNLGIGILLESGSADMLQASGDAEKSIDQHGPGGPCRLWTIPDDDLWASEVVTCSSGGILAMDGDISGKLLIIKSNAGDGLNASGNMTLIDSTVCDNTGNQIVTGGTETLNNVTQVCN